MARRPVVGVFLGPQGSVTPRQLAARPPGTTDLVCFVDSREPMAPALASVARTVAPTEVIDYSHEDAVVAAIRRGGVTAVTTFMDAYCSLVDHLNHVVFGQPDRTGRWRKDRQRQMLADAGLTAVRNRRLGSAEQLATACRDWGYPLVVKPAAGVGSRESWLLRDDADYRAFAHAGVDLAAMVVEQYIAGARDPNRFGRADYLSVELFVCGERRLATISDRPPLADPFRETGVIGPTNVTPAQSAHLVDLARAGHAALGGGNGAFHIEIKLGADRPEIIEINGRMGGHTRTLLDLGTGVDAAALTLAAAAGTWLDVDVEWRRCVAALTYQAPRSATQVVRSPDRRSLLALPGALQLERWSPPGTRLDWRNGTADAVVWLWLAGADEKHLASNLSEAVAFLMERFDFRDAAGRRVVDRQWAALVGAGPGGDSPA